MLEQLLDVIAKGIAERMLNNADFISSIAAKVQGEVEFATAELDSKIEDAIDKHDFSRTVEDCIEAYDFSDIVESAIDIDSKLEDKLSDIEVNVDNVDGFEEAVLRTVRDALRR
jgi:hypothetical protein